MSETPEHVTNILGIVAAVLAFILIVMLLVKL